MCALGFFATVVVVVLLLVVLLLLLLLTRAYLAGATCLLACGRDRRGSLIVLHGIRTGSFQDAAQRCGRSVEGVCGCFSASRNAGGDTAGRHRRVIGNTLF